MAIKALDITANANHAAAGVLIGWSIRGTGLTFRLREETVSGQILHTEASNSSQGYREEGYDTAAGVYVEVVAGTLDEGVLLYR